MKLFSLMTVCLIFSFSHCSLFQTQEKQSTSESLYKSCMETFSDEVKCKEMEKKAIEKGQVEKPKRVVELTPEEESKLLIRDELKNLLMMKNKVFVIEKLGEPDMKKKDGSGKEYYHYYRPITRFSVEHDPDKELIIVFTREMVNRILHTPPDSTPDGKIMFQKKIPR